MNNASNGIDALLPQAIAEWAESIGAQKAQRDALTLFVLAVLAGAFIALGAMFSTTVQSGAQKECFRSVSCDYGRGRHFASDSFWWLSAVPNCLPAMR